MQFIITDAWLAKSRAVHLSGTRMAVALAAASLVLMAATAGLYHYAVVKTGQWPIIGAQHELEQRDRFLRENLDAMARKLGDMQAKMLQLEALGERVSGLAGINPGEVRAAPARGGILVEGNSLSMQELQATLNELDRLTGDRGDLLTVMESRLIDQRLKKMMVPTQKPVQGGNVGSAYGWRIDPFTGRSALHTGLDFQADTGTPILAAAGGVVVASEVHPQFGNMVEVDHGNDLVTRYAHASRLLVKKGDLVKRGQKLAEVGTTGRSTGPHLHFEVLVQGVQQDPHKFLSGPQNTAALGTVAQAAPQPASQSSPVTGRMGR